MDETPPKRRKTSPTTSAPVGSLYTDGENHSGNGRPTTPSRASYMSPTRASLARFNPEIAMRLSAQPMKAQRKNNPVETTALQDGSVSRLKPTPLRSAGSHDNDLAKTQLPGEMVEQGAWPDRSPQSPGRMSASPRRRSRTPGRPASPLKVVSGNHSATISAPVSNIEPTKITDEAASIVNAHVESTLPAITVAQSGIQSADTRHPELPYAGEPELPPTPVQLGLEQPAERPRGIDSSSPGSRKGKRRGERSPVKSSPLKPADPPPSRLEMVDADSRVLEATTAQRPIPRKKHVEDPEVVEKRKDVKMLAVQLEELQHDVTRLEAELELGQHPKLMLDDEATKEIL